MKSIFALPHKHLKWLGLKESHILFFEETNKQHLKVLLILNYFSKLAQSVDSTVVAISECFTTSILSNAQ
jgi:hypothetical protein